MHLSQDDKKGDIRECPCGNEYHARLGRCRHIGQEPYSARFRTAAGNDGIEEGVIGPEGNRIPLWRTIFSDEGREYLWFDANSRAHQGQTIPYPEV